MTFTAYIERQKNLIKSRHDGDDFTVTEGEGEPQSESQKLFEDLNSLKGLNTLERLSFTRKI